ncbi:MAG: L,D-transpeptidase family protein [Syntrophales bacterium]|nr:L,D-transpeptidase family protein [Syntrophales bacterium]
MFALRLRSITFVLAALYAVFFMTLEPCRARADVSEFPEKRDGILVPGALIALASNYAVVVDKSGQKIYAFHSNDKGMELHFKASCSTGMNDGSKERTGDGRTPEGIYFATERYTERELSTIYGPLAFNLNYPNFIDNRKGRTGYNIWIHGTDANLSPFQSNGCVVLANDDIMRLSRFIELNKTPIIILNRVEWVSEDAIPPSRKELKGFLEVWVNSLKAGRFDELSRMYESEELIDMASLNKITDRLRSWESDNLETSFSVDAVSILRHERHAVITFDQALSFRDRSWTLGHRILFLGRNQDRWVISGDHLRDSASPDLLGEQLAIIDTMVRIYAGVEEMIEGWRVSWQSGNMKEYASYYTPDFTGGGMNLSRWIAHKKRVARINRDITVTIGDLDITPGSHEAKVSFMQKYRSSGHSDVGIKTLYLKKVNDRWKIRREEWRVL